MAEEIFFAIAAFIVGACIGSFVNVCIYRLPRNESVVSPPSRCPYCRSKIAFYDNIPFVSYIVLLGRCRHCGIYIPFRYFAVELMTAFASMLLFIKYGFGPLYVIYFALAASLIAITFIDIRHRIIPNEISILGTIIGLVLSVLLSYQGSEWPVTLKDSVIGSIAGGGSLLLVGSLYSLITGREGIGLGDVKLTAMFGAFFG